MIGWYGLLGLLGLYFPPRLGACPDQREGRGQGVEGGRLFLEKIKLAF